MKKLSFNYESVKETLENQGLENTSFTEVNEGIEVKFIANWDFAYEDFINFIEIEIKGYGPAIMDGSNTDGDLWDWEKYNDGNFESVEEYATVEGCTHKIIFGEDIYYFKIEE
jgi:hypothetical protein